MLEIYHAHLDDKRTIVDYLDPWAVMRVTPFENPAVKQCVVTLYPQSVMGTGIAARLTIHGDARTIARNIAISKHSNQLIVCPNGKW